jgi:hypothetical protein
MNDTETEARRLLTAATEDMPSGIDLLDGFKTARRRDRTRRTRIRAAVSGAVAVAAAAIAAVTLTVGSAPSAAAAVTSALNRTLAAQSYHLTEVTSMYYLVNGQVKGPSQGTCVTEADPRRHLSEFSCGKGAVAAREIGKYTYTYFPGAAGKRWQRQLTSSIGHLPGAVNAVTQAIPQQMLADIKKADTVTEAGSASGPGWTGTRYSFTSYTTVGVNASLKITGTLDVDQQGQARVLVFTSRTGSSSNALVTTQVLTFSDWGAPVTVTAPPADQTTFGPW